MKKLFSSVMLVSALVFGACGAGSGILTVTDIPAKYNGMYAMMETETPDGDTILGAYDKGFGGVKISGGKANIPTWYLENESYYEDIKPYTGNETVEGMLIIISNDDGQEFAVIFFEHTSISFKKGSAKVSCKDADGIEE
ncbi:MAG: hypothetical protein LBH16_02005 [Treponema sp.]|nr:hypothetical protein [Treponema sp.]